MFGDSTRPAHLRHRKLVETPARVSHEESKCHAHPGKCSTKPRKPADMSPGNCRPISMLGRCERCLRVVCTKPHCISENDQQQQQQQQV